MRTVFLGTSDFAVTVLERLASSECRPALVVTRPDRPRGRGRTLQSPPVADAARVLGLDLVQPEDLHAPETIARIDAANAAALTLCAYGALVKEPLLGRGILNVHPSLLPRWRGAAPIERAIMAGDTTTGVSIMRLTAELDAGPVCLRGEEPIAPDDTYGTLAPRLAELAGDLLVRALEEGPPFADQPADGVTYAEKIGPEDRHLDPDRPAPELARTVRALTPHIGAHLLLDGSERLGVLHATPAEAGPEPGMLEADGDRLLLGCGGGTALHLHEVRPAGRTAMDAASFLRGRPPLPARAV